MCTQLNRTYIDWREKEKEREREWQEERKTSKERERDIFLEISECKGKKRKDNQFESNLGDGT